MPDVICGHEIETSHYIWQCQREPHDDAHDHDKHRFIRIDTIHEPVRPDGYHCDICRREERE